MKKYLNYMLAMVAVMMCSLHCSAYETAAHDTVFFYDSWAQMLDMEPSAMLVDPFFEAVSPYEIYVYTGDDDIDQMIMEDHIAISLSDSVMLISSDYLNKNYEGKAYHLRGFIPLYFNEKLAFITYNGNLSIKDLLFGTNVYSDDNTDQVFKYDYYYIDFLNHKLERVTPSYLSLLLEDYHDLQMRYEGMKDYKKQYIIDEFFNKFIDRASEDFMRPYILDLVE